MKFAFLVDYNNVQQIREAIQLSTSLWGGAYCPIIPFFKRKPKSWREKTGRASAEEISRGLIEAYDPDILVKMTLNNLPSYIIPLGLEVIMPNDLWRHKNHDLLPNYGVGIFSLFKHLFNEHFKYKAKYPVEVILTRHSGSLALYWSSVFGEMPEMLMKGIEEHYLKELEITERTITPADFKLLLNPYAFFPRRITQQFLKIINQAGFRERNYMLLIDATKPDDILEYWNLRALGRNVIAIPVQLFAEPAIKEVALSYLIQNFQPIRFNEQVYTSTTVIPSSYVTMEQAQEFVNSLDYQKHVTVSGLNHVVAFQSWSPRIWDEWARDKDGVVCDNFYSEEKTVNLDKIEHSVVSFDSMLPKIVDNNFYSHAICSNEIKFRLYGSNDFLAETYPKSSGRNYLKTLGSFAALRKQWRVGSQGLIKLVSYVNNEKWEIPNPQSVFFAWLKDKGYEAVASVPGLVAKRLFEILEGNIDIFEDENLLSLLEHMNGGAVTMNKKPVIGKELIVNRERELEYGQIKTRLQSPAKQDHLLEYLVSKKIFQVGLRVKCPHCFRDSWYPTEKILNTLNCPLCLNEFPATGSLEKGKWCYKTTGPFSIPQYASGAYATLLTLRFIKEINHGMIKTTPALSFNAKTPSGGQLEADFAMFWQESRFGETKAGILFGECKTYGEFKKIDVDRMSTLARQFPGAIIVFSTLRKKLNNKEIGYLKALAKKGRKYWKNETPVNAMLILTGNELFDIWSLKDNWEKLGIDVKSYNHDNLLALCNFTQQIYLKLPSWYEEWGASPKNSSKKRKNEIDLS